MFSILLAGLFLFLAFRKLDWEAFLSALRNANYGFIPLIFIWGSASNWIRALRWRTLLATEKDIRAKNVFWANMAGYLGNNILPARAGELIRAAYVSKENNISASFSLATGLVERFIDLIALVILGSISLTVSGILSKTLQDALKAMSGIAIIGAITLLIVPYFGDSIRRMVDTLPIKHVAAREKVAGFLNQFLRGIEALHHPKQTLQFLLFTCLIWLMDGIGTIILARALQLDFSLAVSFLLLAGLGLSSAIPSTPGYVGVYQFVAVVVLQPFGIANAKALAFIIFFQIISLISIAIWGGLAIWRSPFRAPKA